MSGHVDVSPFAVDHERDHKRARLLEVAISDRSRCSIDVTPSYEVFLSVNPNFSDREQAMHRTLSLPDRIG